MRNSRKALKNLETPRSIGVPDEALYHFRLCHACLHLNESDKEVTTCERCHRLFPTQVQIERTLALPAERHEEGDDFGFDDDVEEYGPEFEDEGNDLSRRRTQRLQGLSVRW